MPTTLSNGSTITSIPTTVFETDGKTVKTRNYGFYLKKTYTDKDHTELSSCELRFQRVREWSTDDGITEDEAKKRNTPTAERAYLQLRQELMAVQSMAMSRTTDSQRKQKIPAVLSSTACSSTSTTRRQPSTISLRERLKFRTTISTRSPASV